MKPLPPHLLDLTGLPDEVVNEIHRLVVAARTTHPAPPLPTTPVPVFAIPPRRRSAEESKRMLDEMAAMGSGQSLPVDWSRADLYEDHD